MWFKNLALFRFTEPFTPNQAQLEERLEAFCFRSCGKLEFSTLGWIAPLQPHGIQLVHSVNGFVMLCLCKEEKVLPPVVVNERLSERIVEIEKKQHRLIRKKERDSLRDEVIHELLPRALSFSRRTYAYIDLQGQWLVVDSGSNNNTDELTTLLRTSLGTLAITPPSTRERPTSVLTRWLKEQKVPEAITLEDECELRSSDEEGNIVRCKRQDLFSEEIQAHLKAGKECIKLAMTWNNRLKFVVDENLGIKRLRFLDLIQEQAAELETDDKSVVFDGQFSIMTLELAAFFPGVLELFGGENIQNKQ